MSVTRFVHKDGRRLIEGDWYPGSIPAGIEVDASAYLGTSYSFSRCGPLRLGAVQIGRGASLCDGTTLDIGPAGVVRLGEFALVTSARIVCDREIEIGPYALVSWDVVLMDSYRVPTDPAERRRFMRAEPGAHREAPRPIRLGRNSWVGFGVCVLPGVQIGDGSIVAARSVVAADVPPDVVVAGNPARVVRRLGRDARAPA
jgi:hypothetical protein